MKIAFFEVTETEKENLKRLLDPLQAEFYEDKLREENAELAKDADIVSVFVNSSVSPKIIESLPNLKLIATRSTGFDHIDKGAAAERDIKIVNVPAYGSKSVAEFAFALILTLSRKIFSARHQLIEGDNFDISKLEGFDLHDKTLGIVGTGRIGKNVARIAKGFGMNIIAHDPFPNESFAKEIGFKYVTLPELLSTSDIITLHVPYTKETYHLINKDNIPSIKKGAYLINTARGEIVETDAMITALANGQLAGAGLDVLEGERDLKEEIYLLAKGSKQIKEDFKLLYENQVLLDMPQVVVTPHIAFCSKEAKTEIQKTTVENIKSFISGSPQNLVR